MFRIIDIRTIRYYVTLISRNVIKTYGRSYEFGTRHFAPVTERKKTRLLINLKLPTNNVIDKRISNNRNLGQTLPDTRATVCSEVFKNNTIPII